MNNLPITRAKLAGKRRWAIYSHDLANYSKIPLSFLIHDLLKDSQLRDGIDYTYNAYKESYALSLASAQALIIMSFQWANAETSSAWQTWHAITDYIQGQSYDNTPPTAD